MNTPHPLAGRGRAAGWIAVGVLAAAVLAVLAWLAPAALAALTEGPEAADSAAAGPSASAPAVSDPTVAAPTAEPAVAPTPGPAEAATGIAALVDAAWLERAAAATGIPPRALAAYAGADLRTRQETGCAVGWNTLAGIGLVESAHGTIDGGSIGEDGIARPQIVGIPLDGTRSAAIRDTDGGALDGDTVWDRAVGPMQFIPDTWVRWGSDGDGDGRDDIHHIDDAALAAARYLCHARGSLDDGDSWVAAIRSYNDDDAYVQQVSDAATRYASLATG